MFLSFSLQGKKIYISHAFLIPCKLQQFSFSRFEFSKQLI